MRRILLALGILSMALGPRTWAGTGLDVGRWLDRPGVRLLAVELYATWCKPCMEAVPKWKALHERHRRDGLRLVVVATQDPQGGCSNPGWNPDDVICDDDGSLARALGAGTELPAAFLWSWQGHLLVRKGRVEEVEQTIERWLKDAPRVALEVSEVDTSRAHIGRDALRDLVRAQIQDANKLDVVATAAEKARLDRLKAESYKQGYDDRLQCEVGKDLSANSLLDVHLSARSDKPRLQLSLLSAERGCLVASSVIEWDQAHPRASVAEAVGSLLQRLRPEVEMRSERSIGETASWEPKAEEQIIARFVSDPPGAVVMLDGHLLCQDTRQGCSRTLRSGPHEVTMERERYRMRSEKVVLAKGSVISWKLEPDFASIDVTTSPSDLSVTLDGEPIGKTPITAREIAPGAHSIVVDDPCFRKQGKEVLVERGLHKAIDIAPEKKLSAVQVVAEDESGNATEADVLVDGVRAGSAPGTFTVGVCARRIEVRSKDGGWSSALSLEEKKVTVVKAHLTKGGEEGKRPMPALSGNNSTNVGALTGLVLDKVAASYFDPARVEPKKMMAKAVETLGSRFNEIEVDHLRVRVGGASFDARVDDLRDVRALSARMKALLAFIQAHAPPGRDLASVEIVALNGALSALDPHSIVISSHDYAEMLKAAQGKFAGVGIVLAKRDDGLKILRILPDGPASRAGVPPKAKLTEIDGRSTANMALEEAIDLLRGDVGTRVELGVERPSGGAPARFTLTRAMIAVPSVRGLMLDRAHPIAYLALSSFSATTPQDVSEAVRRLAKESGGELVGLVIDLRGNPGGLLDSAVKVADEFMSKGDIVTTSGEGGKLRETKNATAQDTDFTMPLVVLADHRSASAAEIVAGALQHSGRAIMIGDRTLGKGTVQLLYQLAGGAALKLSIAQYLSSGGLPFAGTGLEPDLKVAPTPDSEDEDQAERPVEALLRDEAIKRAHDALVSANGRASREALLKGAGR